LTRWTDTVINARKFLKSIQTRKRVDWTDFKRLMQPAEQDRLAADALPFSSDLRAEAQDARPGFGRRTQDPQDDEVSEPPDECATGSGTVLPVEVGR